jgi:four helix bundle protein
MTPEELRDRTTAFAADIVRFSRQLRRKAEGRDIADQLVERCRYSGRRELSLRIATRSKREFVSKLAIAVEEADETVGWLDIVTRSGTASSPETESLRREARELLAILSASRKTADHCPRSSRKASHGGNPAFMIRCCAP